MICRNNHLHIVKTQEHTTFWTEKRQQEWRQYFYL